MIIRKFILCVIIMIVAYTSITAQTADNKYSISLNIINTNYNGDYGNGIWNFNHIYGGWGVSFGVYYNPSFDIGVQGSSGSYGFVKDNANAFKLNKFDMKLLGRFKLNNGYLLEETLRYSPFVVAGVGFATYSPRIPGYPDRVTEGTDFIIPIGAGFNYQLTDGIAVQYQYLYNFTNKDQRDENRATSSSAISKMPIYSSKKGNDAYGEHILSLVYTFGTATNKAFIATTKDKVRTRFAGKKEKDKSRPLIASKVQINENKGDSQKKETQPVVVVKEVETAVTPLQDDKVVLDTATHITRYVVGTKKELIEQNILTPDGWFRPARVLESNFDKDYFVKIDAQTTNSISLYAANAKLLTIHPTSSYLLQKINGCVTLQIIDPQEFWTISNYLVIEVY